MSVECVKVRAPKDATHYLISAGHAWYFKGNKIYYLHEWFDYKNTCFKFDLSKRIKL